MKNRVFIGLGTNLDARFLNLENAIFYIENEIGELLKKSSVYQTKAWGNTNQQDFLNQVIEIKTEYNVFEVLEKCLSIEAELGRIRKEKWGERLIDIDILYFNNEIIGEKNLKVPHPFIQDRNFVLVPMVEIAKGYIHPGFNKTNLELLENCKDGLEVKKL